MGPVKHPNYQYANAPEEGVSDGEYAHEFHSVQEE